MDTVRPWLGIVRRPWFLIALAAVLGIVVAASPMGGLDFRVYREGAKVLFAGPGERSLYDPMPHDLGTRGLPFTYPPFAAVLFLPFALMPATLGMVLISATSLLCLLAVAVLGVAYVDRAGALGWFGRSQARRGAAVLLATLLLGLSGPWRESLDFGQINAMIMMLIVVDLVRPAGRIPRGVLIGVAAGIKLTPLAFGLIFLARREFKPLLGMAAGFAGSITVGWVLAGRESLVFWSSVLGSATRVGDPSDMYNLSLNSLMFHVGLEGTAQRVAWAVACLAMVAVGYAAIRVATRRGSLMAGIVINALVMLAISPVSWFHHWVWVGLALPVLWVAASRRIGAERLLGRILCLALYVSFYLSSYALTILISGQVQNTGPLSWKLISSLGLLLSLAVLGWGLATRPNREAPTPAAAADRAVR